jgi:hypothetical protein
VEKEARLRECGKCGGEVEQRYRFCPWCAAPQRLKVTELFFGDGGLLRVSRYYDAPGQRAHLRVSVWNEGGEAQGVVSLDDADANKLGAFLRDTAPPAQDRGLRSLLDRLR